MDHTSLEAKIDQVQLTFSKNSPMPCLTVLLRLRPARTGMLSELSIRCVQLAEDELIVPLLKLARAPHSLNYIVFRTILLFTFTAKSIKLLAKHKVIPLIMHSLRRPQEPTCLRFR